MITQRFTSVNEPGRLVSIESSTKPSIANDAAASYVVDIESPSRPSAARNPLVAQYLSLDQAEADYSKFGISNLSTESITEEGNGRSCAASATHRKKRRSKPSVKPSKSCDQTALSQVARGTMIAPTSINKRESVDLHVTNEFQPTLYSHLSSVPCTSASNLHTLESFQDSLSSIPQHDSFETSNAKDTLQLDNDMPMQFCDMTDGFDELADEDLMTAFADLLPSDGIEDLSSDDHSTAVKYGPSSSVCCNDSETSLLSGPTSTTNDELSVFRNQQSTNMELSEKGMAERKNRSSAATSVMTAIADGNATNCSHQFLRAPIVRPPFPEPVRERSRLIGVSCSTYLRTCFRIGEAIKEGSLAVQSNKDVVLELYAKVDSSWREPSGLKQHFVFSDLFHDRPPKLFAVFELCMASELWAYDSAQFLGAKGKGRKCRCIGKLKRESNAWKMVVLNIWEATWNDIENVHGIICAW